MVYRRARWRDTTYRADRERGCDERKKERKGREREKARAHVNFAEHHSRIFSLVKILEREISLAATRLMRAMFVRGAWHIDASRG